MIGKRSIYVAIVVMFGTVWPAVPASFAQTYTPLGLFLGRHYSPPGETAGSGSVVTQEGRPILSVAQAGDLTPRRVKAFLPNWVLWVAVPGLILMWVFVTFTTFRAGAPRTRYAIFRWLAATALFMLVGVLLWLLASGRLPAFLIEVE